MKKVVNPQTVAHMWANQTQREARTATSNLYFDGAAIWSYGSHFCIAKHVTNEQEQKAVLFTTRGYSNTTSKHKYVVLRAISGNTIFCSHPDSQSSSFLSWLQQAEGAMYAANKAKQKRTKLKELAKIIEIKKEVLIYCEFFGINLETSYPVLFAALNIQNLEEVNGYQAKKEEAQKLAKKLEAAKAKKQLTKDLKKFRNFETVYLYGNNTGFDYLRFNTETQRVETSQRIEIPLRTAKSFYSEVLKTIETGKCDVCGSKFMEAYEIKEINNKFIQIGCHKIEIKEVKKLAVQLGW